MQTTPLSGSHFPDPDSVPELRQQAGCNRVDTDQSVLGQVLLNCPGVDQNSGNASSSSSASHTVQNSPPFPSSDSLPMLKQTMLRQKAMPGQKPSSNRKENPKWQVRLRRAVTVVAFETLKELCPPMGIAIDGIRALRE